MAYALPRYDRAGNLTFDGHYFYQYDAWNRLIQVNLAHEATAGNLDPTVAPVLDAMVKHFAYDGLGRLIRTQSPFPDWQTANGRVRSEWFYYDGVRRIQEVVSDPLLSLGEVGLGSPQLQQLAGETGPQKPEEVDQSAANVAFEQGQLEGAEIIPEPILLNTGSWLSREYGWRPGDGAAGVDELPGLGAAGFSVVAAVGGPRRR